MTRKEKRFCKEYYKRNKIKTKLFLILSPIYLFIEFIKFIFDYGKFTYNFYDIFDNYIYVWERIWR